MTPKILLINNLYSESESLRNACRDSVFDFDEFRHTELNRVNDLDTYVGVILSGTGDSPDEKLHVYADEIALVRKLSCPVLGICGGAQILALADDGRVGDTERPIGGRRQVNIDEADPLFDDLPNPFTVLSKHRRYITGLPRGYRQIATETQDGFPYVIRKTDSLVYAVQFHPERRNDGTKLMKNFFEICGAWHQKAEKTSVSVAAT